MAHEDGEECQVGVIGIHHGRAARDKNQPFWMNSHCRCGCVKCAFVFVVPRILANDFISYCCQL